jgi:isocitrate dehydrogenase (NAD+)
MTYRVTLIPGDGIGPEVTSAARRVIDSTGVSLRWEVVHVSADAPLDVPLASIASSGVALKGPVSTPVGKPSPNVALRRALDLYVQIRHARSLAGRRGVNVAIIRETTEDLYAQIEFEARSAAARSLIRSLRRDDIHIDSALSLKPVSEPAARRAVTFALGWARSNKRCKVTVVHKATTMPATDGLFLTVARDAARDFPDVELDDLAVDTAAAQLVRRPGIFDVVLTTNLYGDILADVAAAVVGGVGTVAGANFGDGIAVFEAAHGSAPRHAGLNRANPIAAILCGALLLRHLGEDNAAARVEAAVAAVVVEGRTLTYDLGGEATTTEVGDAVVAALG